MEREQAPCPANGPSPAAPPDGTSGAAAGEPSAPERLRRAADGLLVASLLAILLLTLVPGAAGDRVEGSFLCILCGEAGVANLLRNILLFLPLGVALGIRTRTFLLAWTITLGLTLGVEVAQHWVPGRNPLLADVLANGAGGALGVWAGHWFRRRVARGEGRKGRGGSPAGSRGPAVAWVLLLGGVTAASGWALEPELPEGPLLVQWTARHAHMEVYQGRVEEVVLEFGGGGPGSGGHDRVLPLVPGGMAEEAPFRAFVLGAPGEALIRFQAGPRPRGMAPLLGVYTPEQEEALLLAIRGDDLIVRQLHRGARMGLAPVDRVILGVASGVEEGSIVELRLTLEGGRACARAGGREGCSPSLSGTEGWALLLQPSWFPDGTRFPMAGAWMFLMGLPLGMMALSRRRKVQAMGSALALLSGLEILAAVMDPFRAAWGFSLGILLTGAGGLAAGVVVGDRVIRWFGRAGVAILASMLLVQGCGTPDEDLPPLRMEPPVADSLPSCGYGSDHFEVEERARGLEVPWAMAEAPDGRIFLTERPGRVRVVNPWGLDPDPWATLPVVAEGENGLMGIALAPDFADSGVLFLMGREVASSERRFPGWLQPLVRRVRSWRPGHDEGSRAVQYLARFQEEEGRGVETGRLIRDIPSGEIHGGGALLLGPEGTLLYSVGDYMTPALSHDPRRVPGKILAVDPAGASPRGRPPHLPGEMVARGVRNSQGMALDPASGTVFFLDHGPSGLTVEGGRQGADELNVLLPGGDYGWPMEAGRFPDPSYLPPLRSWTPAVAPAGLALSSRSEGGVVAWVAGLRGEVLLRIELVEATASPHHEVGGWAAICEDPLFVGEFGRLRAVLVAADGSIWVTTSNRDGRGSAGPGHDLLLRIIEKETP